MLLFDLFWSFGKVGVFGFGGGPSMIPLIQNEVVDVKGWLSREEFLDAFAFGNTLPGPIATKLAGYVGYKVGGWGGAVMGLAGIAVPTILAMIVLISVFLRFRDAPAINGFLRGVRPIVIALLALVVYDFIPSAFGAPGAWLGNWALWLLAITAFALSIRFNVHPALLIVVGGALGVAFFR